jgi:hypothetical protein
MMRLASLVGYCFVFVLAVPGCRREGPAYPKRDLGDFVEKTKSDSVGTADMIRSTLRLEPPLRLSTHHYWDGGTTGGILVGTAGDTLRFSLAGAMNEPDPGYLYLGAEHYRNPGSRRLVPGSPEERALAAALILYGGADNIAIGVANILVGAPGYRDLRGSVDYK